MHTKSPLMKTKNHKINTEMDVKSFNETWYTYHSIMLHDSGDRYNII